LIEELRLVAALGGVEPPKDGIPEYCIEAAKFHLFF